MTTLLLAAIVFGGLSFLLWGCVGWCRLIEERAARDKRMLLVAPAAIVVCAVGVVLLEITIRPVIDLSTALLDDPATDVDDFAIAAISTLWFPLCGTVTALVAARVFGVRELVVGAVVLGIPFWLLATIASQDDFAPAVAAPWSIAFKLSLLGTSIGSAMIGVLLADGTRRAPTEPVASDRGGRCILPSRVAVLIPAHDEEQSLPSCLAAVVALVPRENIFIASDGSTDATVQIAKDWGCNVLDIQPNGGKAHALQVAIDHFAIGSRFEAVMIVDADAKPAPDYLDHALPLFDDPAVVAVAGHAIPHWCDHQWPRWSMFFAAYRTRLYRVIQAMVRYAQTWRHSNVTYIVPGFSSMYRTSVLPLLDVGAPGLAVEDFNMTFAIHRRRLGRIAYSPRAQSVSQEAYWFTDYWKQVTRWYLGFWQTVRRHGVWASGFWVALGVLVVEMLAQSVVFVTLPLVLLALAAHGGDPISLGVGDLVITAGDVAVGVFIADYTMTAIVAVIERKPILFVYGLGFIVLRWVDALLFLITLPRAFLTTSDGRWVSPRRLHGS